MWEKGQSGNPSGRPPSNISITSYIKDRASQIDPKTGLTYAAIVAYKLFDMVMMQGNLQAAQELLNRIDGKVTERHEIAGLIIHATPEMLEQAQDRLKISMGQTEELLADYQEHKLLGQGIESVERENL